MSNSRMKLVVPSIYRTQDGGWGWHQLAELAKVVRVTPMTLIARWWCLNETAHTMNKIRCADMAGVETLYNFEQLQNLALDDPEGTFLPAGWGSDILDAIQKGKRRKRPYIGVVKQGDAEERHPDFIRYVPTNAGASTAVIGVTTWQGLSK